MNVGQILAGVANKAVQPVVTGSPKYFKAKREHRTATHMRSIREARSNFVGSASTAVGQPQPRLANQKSLTSPKSRIEVLVADSRT